MSKIKDTRIVTFAEDYKPSKKVIYQSGSTHAIHFKTVEKLKEKGVKFKAKPLEASEVEKIRETRKSKTKE